LAKASPQQLALQVLSHALNDPSPKVLHGGKGKGIFESAAAAAKQAAQFCLEQRWLEATGQFEGKGKSRKELYRITSAGIRAVLDHSEPVTLLRDSLTVLERQAGQFQFLQATITNTLAALQSQKEMVAKLSDKLRPPDVEKVLQKMSRGSEASTATRSPGADLEWLSGAVAYLADYQRRQPFGHCPLPELFHGVAEPRGVTIGGFHDGLRRLVQEGRIRLHPYTGPAYQLQDEQYALVAGQEIKYYAERLANA
jgi:hypothetical protein